VQREAFNEQDVLSCDYLRLSRVFIRSVKSIKSCRLNANHVLHVAGLDLKRDIPKRQDRSTRDLATYDRRWLNSEHCWHLP
jgi:hypothetical protein